VAAIAGEEGTLKVADARMYEAKKRGKNRVFSG
jgi:GGDEF domain-containing protein